MKREPWLTAAVAAALSFLIAFGAVGCVVSGFDLPLDSFARVVLICGVASVFCAAAFSLKWGGIGVLCALALAAGYLWRRDETAEQLFGLLYRITSVYGRAYGWNPIALSEEITAVADIPMAVLGALLSATVAWSICRKLGAVLPMMVSLLPLCACMVVTDTVPEEGYLFCLLLGLIILLITGRVRMQSASQGNRLAVMTTLPAALALLALFLAFPQVDYVNRSEATRDAILSWFQSVPEKVENAAQKVTASTPSREPEHVSLASLGRRIESPARVMEVTAEVGGTLYLRGQDYDGYDGMTWAVSQHRSEDFSLIGEDYGDVVIRTASQRALLYLPYYPARSMTLLDGKMDNTWSYTEYVIPRAGLPDNWRVTAVSAATNPPDPDSPYLALPDDTRARAQALLADILGGASSAVEKAEKIGDYVRTSARYDLNPSRMGDGETDFALWFLEDAEAGYCVHFATAAAVLLRAAGIEARYVSGYLVKTASDAPAVVTEKNAHAWAEYYEPALGVWLVLEATPPDMAAAQPPAVQAVPDTTPEILPPTTPESTDAVPSATSPSRPEASAEPAPTQQDRSEHHGSWKIPAVVFILALLLLAVEAQRNIRIRLRRRRQQSAPPNTRGLAMWQETDLLSRLLGQAPPQALETLAQKAKFSQHTLTAEELKQFTQYLSDVRHQLGRKPWYLRLVYRYLYAVM